MESDLDGLRKSFKDAIMEARASWDQKVEQLFNCLYDVRIGIYENLYAV